MGRDGYQLSAQACEKKWQLDCGIPSRENRAGFRLSLPTCSQLPTPQSIIDHLHPVTRVKEGQRVDCPSAAESSMFLGLNNDLITPPQSFPIFPRKPYQGTYSSLVSCL
jgi:hypothetical protein